MQDLGAIIFHDMSVFQGLTLILASFAGSFITIALGIGGGAMLLAVMASILPAAALIPLHGVIQLGSNATRAIMMWRETYWQPLVGFSVGAIIGAALGGSIAVNLPPALVQIGVGLFIIWSVLAKPPRWLSHVSWAAGGVSSFLTMFFGATGPFVASYIKALSLPRHAHTATQAVAMTVQHGLKTTIFAMFGFAFWPWIPFLIAMILAGALGTWAGKFVLNWQSDARYGTWLNYALIAVALRLIWGGITSLA